MRGRSPPRGTSTFIDGAGCMQQELAVPIIEAHDGNDSAVVPGGANATTDEFSVLGTSNKVLGWEFKVSGAQRSPSARIFAMSSTPFAPHPRSSAGTSGLNCS
jgi:hypothetical protein